MWQTERDSGLIGRGLPIPVSLRVLIERREHDRQDDVDVVADEVAEVLVVPEVERSFRDLRAIS